jgi:hypothetical protein
VGLKINGTHKLLVYADDVNQLGGNIDTIKKNTEILIGAIKDVRLRINTEKKVYIAVSSPKCREKLRHKGRQYIL